MQRFLIVGVRRVIRLQLALGETAQQIEPDEVGTLRQTGAEVHPCFRRPVLAQQTQRAEVVRQKWPGWRSRT